MFLWKIYAIYLKLKTQKISSCLLSQRSIQSCRSQQADASLKYRQAHIPENTEHYYLRKTVLLGLCHERKKKNLDQINSKLAFPAFFAATILFLVWRRCTSVTLLHGCNINLPHCCFWLFLLNGGKQTATNPPATPSDLKVPVHPSALAHPVRGDKHHLSHLPKRVFFFSQSETRLVAVS